MCMHLLTHMWRSKENLEELILSYCEESWDQTQVTSLGSKPLYLLSHLAYPLRRTLCGHPLSLLSYLLKLTTCKFIGHIVQVIVLE